MTNKDASFLLGACRPNGSDSADPEFTEALAQARNDPALEKWFDDQRHFDAAVAARLKSVAVPADLRSRILTGGRVSRHEPWFSSRRLWAIAAMLVIFAGLGAWFSMDRPGPGQWQDQALATLGQLVTGREAFDMKSPNVTALQQWLRAKGSPVAGNMPPGVDRFASLGCKITYWHGHPISIICFHGPGGEMFHLAMTDRIASADLPPKSAPLYATRDGWNTASWAEGDMAIMLITKAPQSTLQTLLAVILPPNIF